MGKDPKKPRGKMSSYAYFVQTCREEHKKKHPDASVNFSEFSKKCSERWKTMSPKEKGKFEDMAKQDKLRYEREMKNYVPPKGQKKKRFKDPNAPKRPPSAFFLFCADFCPKIKSENPGLSIGDTAKKLGEMWNSSSAEEKQPYEKKAAKLKEKYDKVIIQNDMEVKLWFFFFFQDDNDSICRTRRITAWFKGTAVSSHPKNDQNTRLGNFFCRNSFCFPPGEFQRLG
uniref:High mobility group protein B2 n=1 Tax=Haplochromis burtoni TaxID=8153 RepID=A0A3Q2WB85_HAPBU